MYLSFTTCILIPCAQMTNKLWYYWLVSIDCKIQHHTAVIMANMYKYQIWFMIGLGTMNQVNSYTHLCSNYKSLVWHIFPPYLISHGQKIGLTRVLLQRVWKCPLVCAEHCKSEAHNLDATWSPLEVAQSYLVSLRVLFGKDPTQPIFCSIADGAIICGCIGSPGSL